MQQEFEIISGSVENVTFRSEQTGFTVLELNTADEQITVVGTLPFVAEGEQLLVRGTYGVHPNFGPQFKAESCERSMPATSAAILRYLSSGAVKGIGPATASKIVERFAEQTLSILEREPVRLAEISGISRSKAEKIGMEYAKQFGVREVLLKLGNLGITSNEALRIFKRFGASSVDRIMENPYLLCSLGLSFERVEQMTEQFETPVDSEYRIKAGMEYIMRHNLRNGHTCLPKEKIIETAVSLLQAAEQDVYAVCEDMLRREELYFKILGDTEFLFLPDYYRAELYVANRIALIMKVPPNPIAVHENRLVRFEQANGITYDDAQRAAIAATLNQGILTLTGGPGTGKTTTLNAIITLLEEAGLKIALAAPTGRAAKRMTELTGYEAKTIHRLLEVEWAEEDKQIFSRNDKNPLDAGVVIVDELSMVDICLFEALLRALPTGCRLIMVGDADQLPSVGAGNVLHDLINSGTVPVIRLTKVFRQAMESLIVTNAHAILAGEPPALDEKNNDFFMMDMLNTQKAGSLICDLASIRLPKAYDYSPMTDIQVLCPSRKRGLGTIFLNTLLQERLNPPGAEKREWPHKGFVLREGDKVMQIRNNYDIVWTGAHDNSGTGVYNGDIGILLSVDKYSGIMTVRFDDRVATYTTDQAEDLEPAYAITVHKSQGSEFDCVILPVLDMPFQLAYRNLLYTAITRAKKKLIVVGSRQALMSMVKNNKKNRRYTALSEFLKDAAGRGIY